MSGHGENILFSDLAGGYPTPAVKMQGIWCFVSEAAEIRPNLMLTDATRPVGNSWKYVTAILVAPMGRHSAEYTRRPTISQKKGECMQTSLVLPPRQKAEFQPNRYLPKRQKIASNSAHTESGPSAGIVLAASETKNENPDSTNAKKDTREYFGNCVRENK